MKQLMLGNAAVARGLYEAGCGVVSSYPGTPSTEITEECAKYDEIYCEWAPNEKVAMEVAFGASLAGKRSFCGMKHVGLNVAADPLFTAGYMGVNGAYIVVTADDPSCHSSQNEQDNRHYARAAKVPMLEPSDSAEALAFAKLAYELSEQFDTPVLLKMCTRVAHSQSIVDTTERAEREMIPYEKNIAKYVMMPGNAKRRHPVVEERTRKLAQWAETAPVNRVEEGADHKIGIITSSTSYQYVKEVCGDRFPVLKLGMAWPMPEGLIRDFAASVDLLTVVEELDGFIEAHCRAMGLALAGKDVFPCIDEFSQNLVAEKLGLPVHAGRKLDDQIPPRPPVMCAGCPHRGLFYTLNKNKCTVLGDIGCYTLGAVAPLSAMDMTLCMGGSISAIHGFNKARGGESEHKTVAVIGDSTFFHSGMTGLANAVFNHHDLLLVVLDNGTTAMTGHQPNPGMLQEMLGDMSVHMDMEAVVRGLGVTECVKVKAFNLKAVTKALEEMKGKSGVRVLIAEEPCVLYARRRLKKGQPQVAQVVQQGEEALRCLEQLACPAFYRQGDNLAVDETLCSGCMICLQIAPTAFKAKKR